MISEAPWLGARIRESSSALEASRSRLGEKPRGTVALSVNLIDGRLLAEKLKEVDDLFVKTNLVEHFDVRPGMVSFHLARAPAHQGRRLAEARMTWSLA